MASDIQTSENEVFLDSNTGNFVSADDGSVVPLNQRAADDKDESSSSADSVEGFQDDLKDPDYSPEPIKPPITQMKTIIMKTKQPAPNPKRLLPKIQYQPKITLPLTPRPIQVGESGSVSAAPATFCAVPRPVTSPIIINGLNALPIQPGATRGKTIAIRLDNSKQDGQQQQAVVSQSSEAASSPAPPAPARQVLLVNRQGQILIKDPRSNTFQTLSTNSPAYNKISHIAKILHGGNTLHQSVPRVIIKPRPSLPALNVAPASNHTTSERKFIFRVLPVKSTTAPNPSAPISVQTVPLIGFSNNDKCTAQAIIDKAMATHRDTQRPKPIILSNTQQPKAGQQRASQVPVVEDSNQSSVGCSQSPSGFSNEPTPVSSRHQVRVKRVSSVSEKPSRKKSKIDFLKDPSSELEEVQESR